MTVIQGRTPDEIRAEVLAAGGTDGDVEVVLAFRAELDPIERAQQRARAELVLARARLARWTWLQRLAERHRLELPRIEIDDELAVHEAARMLLARGVEVDALALNIPTPDQYLAGRTITPPPS